MSSAIVPGLRQGGCGLGATGLCVPIRAVIGFGENPEAWETQWLLCPWFFALADVGWHIMSMGWHVPR